MFFLPSFLPSYLSSFLCFFLNMARLCSENLVLCRFSCQTLPHADMEGFLRSSFLLRLVSFPLLPSRITGGGKGGR